MYNSADEKQKFKQAILDRNPQMSLAQIVTLGSKTHLKETRFGHISVGCYISYQLTHTESNFKVCVDIFPVPRCRKNNQPLTYPRFPLRDRGPPTVQNSCREELVWITVHWWGHCQYCGEWDQRLVTFWKVEAWAKVPLCSISVLSNFPQTTTQSW